MFCGLGEEQARSQNFKKGGGGGFLERVRQLQATLTPIFIALESDSNSLSENETYFSAEIKNLNGKTDDKGLHRN